MSNICLSCTKNGVFFSAATCKKRHHFWCSKKKFRPFLFCDGFRVSNKIILVCFAAISRNLSSSPHVEEQISIFQELMKLVYFCLASRNQTALIIFLLNQLFIFYSFLVFTNFQWPCLPIFTL